MTDKNYKVTMNQKQYDDWLEHLTFPPNIQDVKKPNKKEYGEENKHPTIKPVKLMEWLVKLLTDEGMTVLEPFTGSGTTLVACDNLGRKAIGCELNKDDYGQTIKNRAPNAEMLWGDCIESMKKIPDNSIDAVITDPPYAIAMADWDKFSSLKDFGAWCELWAAECYRVLKPGGMIASFNAARTYHYMAMAMDNAGFTCRDMIEWVYWNSLPKGKNLKQCHEPIYLGWKAEKNLKNMTFNIDACRIPVKEKKKKGGETVIIINDKVEIPVEIDDGLLSFD